MATTCKNCDNKFEGHYCNNCGQSAHTGAIGWHDIWHHAFHAFTHTDKGILHTIKELTLRPGKALREYISGKRVHHFNPFLFVLIVGGIATLLYHKLHLALPSKEVDLDKLEHISPLLAGKYFAFMSLLFMVIFTFFDYLFFYDKKYRLPELFISNTFQAGQILVLLLAVIPFLLLQKYIQQETEVLIKMRPFIKAAIVGYFFFVRYQFYEAKGNYLLLTRIVIELVIVVIIHNFIIKELIVRYINE